MSIKNVTITSKNQITLPAAYVKTLKLSQSRVLQAKMQGGRIILTPEPDLVDVMQQFWGKHSAKQTMTDTELKQAARSVAAKRTA